MRGEKAISYVDNDKLNRISGVALDFTVQTSTQFVQEAS